MKRLLNSRGALAAAWLVVVAVLAGIAALVVLQPPPPQRQGDPVVVALAPVEPAAPIAGAEPPAAAAEQETPPPKPEAEPVEVALPGETGPEAPASETGPAETQPAESESPEQEPVEDEAPISSPAGEQQAAEQEMPPPEPAPEQQQAPEQQTEQQTADQQAGAQQGTTQQALTRIPVIPPAPEQLEPWRRYSQPFNTEDKRPRIAVVLTGLGLSESATRAAIEQLPAAVTLSFSPYARGLEQWIALARARGHEVMLDLPMEPSTFPNDDPGPQALLTSLAPRDNLDRLDWVLSRGSAYVGVAGSMGSRFTATEEAVEPVLRDVKQRGLLFLDRRTTEDSLVAALAADIGLPYAVNDRTIDERQASRVAIDARLAQIERVALTEGSAVAMAQPYPVSIERLAEWAADLPARGFAVAPITALVERPDAP